MTTAAHARARVLESVAELEDSLIAAVADVVQQPSVSGTDGENEAQSYMAGLLTDGGLDVDHWQLDLETLTAHPDFPGMEVPRSEAWGLVGRLPGAGDGPTLMLNGHIDVVPTGDPDAWSSRPVQRRGSRRPPVRPRCVRHEGRPVGRPHRRAGDPAQSGVALRGDVLMASVQGEEDGGLGTFATLQRGWRADACVIPEPTDLDIIPANSGALTFRLRVHGRATHAARRTEGVSAIDVFWPIWTALRELETAPPRGRRSVDVALAARASVVDRHGARRRLGVVGSRSAGRRRPSRRGARRTGGGRAVVNSKQTVAEACDGDAWLREHPVEVEWWGGQFEAGQLPADSDLVERVRAAHALVGGGSLDVYGAPYGSDLRLLTGLGGIPSVQYGPGDAKLAHGPFESVPDRPGADHGAHARRADRRHLRRRLTKGPCPSLDPGG